MRKLVAALAGALLLVGQAQAQSAPAPSGVAANDPAYAEVAALIVPDELALAQVDPLLAATVRSLFEQDPDLREFEGSYPGLGAAFSGAMRPLMELSVRLTLPLYRAELEQFYASRLSPEEARSFAAFLQSPAGQGMIRGAMSNNDFKAISNDIVAERDISEKALERDVRGAAYRMQGQLSEQHKAEIVGFFSTDLGRKLTALASERRKIDVRWANYVPPELDAEIEKTVIDAMIGHVAKTDPELAESIRTELERQKAE